VKPEQRARFIEQAALREAQKAIKRRGGESLTREDLLGLRVQTISLWIRVPLIVLGLAALAGGVFLMSQGLLGLGVLVVLLGIVLGGAGCVGWRRTLSETLDALGSGLAEGVLEAISHALDGN